MFAHTRHANLPILRLLHHHQGESEPLSCGCLYQKSKIRHYECNLHLALFVLFPGHFAILRW